MLHRGFHLLARAACAAQPWQLHETKPALTSLRIMAANMSALRWQSSNATTEAAIVAADPQPLAPGPRALYNQRVAEGIYRADSRQVRFSGPLRLHLQLHEKTLTRLPTQMNAVIILQQVYDELVSCDSTGAEEDRASGLTLMDSVDTAKSKWSLWDLIVKSEEDGPEMKEVKGLYMYGAWSDRGPKPSPSG